jgi:hypothetical protein
MQKSAFWVECEAPTNERFDCCFGFTVTRRHVNNKSAAFAINYVLQSLKDAFVVLSYYK